MTACAEISTLKHVPNEVPFEKDSQATAYRLEGKQDLTKGLFRLRSDNHQRQIDKIEIRSYRL